jgi:hypothetical protein
MLSAIKQGRDWSKDNTAVSFAESTGGSDVFLALVTTFATVQRNGLALVMVNTLRALADTHHHEPLESAWSGRLYSKGASTTRTERRYELRSVYYIDLYDSYLFII